MIITKTGKTDVNIMKGLFLALIGYKYNSWIFEGELNGEKIHYGIVKPLGTYPNLKDAYPGPDLTAVRGANWNYTPVFKKPLKRCLDIHKYSPYKLLDWTL